MAHIHLVRHDVAAGFGDHKDPGLDDLGRQQAEAVAPCWMRAMAPSANLIFQSIGSCG